MWPFLGLLGILALFEGVEGFGVEDLAIPSFEGIEGDLAAGMEAGDEEGEVMRLGKEGGCCSEPVSLTMVTKPGCVE